MNADLRISQAPSDTVKVMDRCNFIGFALDKVCVPNDQYIIGGLLQLMLNLAQSQGYTKAQFAKFLKNIAAMMELDDATPIGRG